MKPYYEDSTTKLLLCDDIEGLNTIEDGSIDLVFTSPPYNLGGQEASGFARPDSGNKTGKWSGGKLASGYGNHNDNLPHEEYVVWQRRVLACLWSKLSNHGVIFYNHKPRVQDKVLWLPLELNPGLPLRQVIIWARPGGVNFSPSHYCPTYEWIMVFAKPGFALRDRGASGLGDLWTVTPEQSEHPAPFPLGLPARALETVANVRTVLDPYCGSGTTLRAAADLGLNSIGIDNDPWCLDLTVKRLSQQSFGF